MTMTEMTLTKENAPFVSTVECKDSPEWGIKRFSYNEQRGVGDERFSTVGSGCNSKVLFEGEYHLWRVKSLKDGTRV